MTTILLVEDNEMNRDMLSRRLIRKGYDIIMAVDGAEGIAMARREQPDIILLDMSLPVIDGWQVAPQIKQTPETRMIPIIGLSAHAMDGDREKALEAGCDEYEAKPIDFSRLLEKIAKYT
jgi:CheY-like chemotaxis protein